MSQPLHDASSRKKFLLRTFTAFCSATALRIFTRGKKEKSETVKMLTQDGRLVEIDKSQFELRGRKISNVELQKWIKTKPQNN